MELKHRTLFNQTLILSGLLALSQHKHSPIDAGDVDDHVDHITAQLVGLHVYGRAVGGDVDLAHHVKQKGLFYP